MYVRTFEGLGQSTPEARVNGLMKQLQPLFQKNFSRNNITYGPEVGKPVKFRVIADNAFKREVEKEGEQLANSLEHLLLKFAPEKVRKALEGWYKVSRQNFPARLQTINENTRLTREEQVAVLTMAQVMTKKKVRDEADHTGAFYSPFTKEMVFRVSMVNAGIVAHEMAHAYANQGWHDFINLMRLRGMEGTDKLDEGMTTFIAGIVVKDWLVKQPSNISIPSNGYNYIYTNRASEFVKQLGKDLAFEAYFGGWIDFKSNANPEDTLIIGKRKQKKWYWPLSWRFPQFPRGKISDIPFAPI